jgi:hypothetical protein
MDLIQLLVLVLVLAIIFWLVTTHLMPLVPKPWSTIIMVILVLIVVLFLLERVGILSL